jgi:hypothetical protein
VFPFLIKEETWNMDSFSIIQHFFTRLNCNLCEHPFEPEGVQLIREDDGVYLVAVHCHHCAKQIGVAMVGVETLKGGTEHSLRHYPDPELTPEELERLSVFAPVTENDVLNAHNFFSQLDENWMRHLPVQFQAVSVQDVSLEFPSELTAEAE